MGWSSSPTKLLKLKNSQDKKMHYDDSLSWIGDLSYLIVILALLLLHRILLKLHLPITNTELLKEWVPFLLVSINRNLI